MSICFANSVEEPFKPPHDKTNTMAVRPAKIRSAWASAKSDQSLRCPHEESWLVVLRLNVPVNNFSVISGRSHRFLGN